MKRDGRIRTRSRKPDPGDPDATYFYGRLHLAQKEWARAAEVLFYATREAPSFAFAHYFLGLAWLGNNDIAQAQTALAKALELTPLWLEPGVALARIYLASGAYDSAVEESGPILQAQPRNVDILMIAGTARLKKGEAGPALELFQRAKEINPARRESPYQHWRSLRGSKKIWSSRSRV